MIFDLDPAEAIEALRVQRESWHPGFAIESADDAIALINVFGAFK